MTRKIPLLVLVLFACFLFVQAAWAQDDAVEALKKEIQELKARLEKVEQDADNELAARVDQYINYNAAGPQQVSECGFLSPKGFDVNIGGFIKVDAAYDTHRTNNGNFAWWVEGPNKYTIKNGEEVVCYGDRRDDEFNLTARQTRLWLDIGGPETGEIKTSARVEVDFYGDGFTENKNALMMRHAYLKAQFPGDWELLAGQTIDIISPLCPRTVNYTVQWNQGNPGYRRPQVKLTKKAAFGEGTASATLGITRTIGGDLEYQKKDEEKKHFGTDDGEDSGFPTVAADFGVDVPCPFFDDRTASFHVSGHYGEEEVDGEDYTDYFPKKNLDFNSWSVNVSSVVPILSWATLQGEWFTGANLDTYLAGIGQGVNTSTWDEIHSKGGWVNILINPPELKGWTFTLGYGIDKPHKSNLSSGGKKSNWVYYGNCFYSITEAVQVGLEVSHLNTRYIGSIGEMQDTRVQFAFIYYF